MDFNPINDELGISKRNDFVNTRDMPVEWSDAILTLTIRTWSLSSITATPS